MLQKGAADDLRSIVRYTKDTWGTAQARAYAEKLREGFLKLAEGRGAYKVLTDMRPDLRVVRCERHYIFCLWRQDAPAIIVAVLHERMDLISRIADRLD